MNTGCCLGGLHTVANPSIFLNEKMDEVQVSRDKVKIKSPTAWGFYFKSALRGITYNCISKNS